MIMMIGLIDPIFGGQSNCINHSNWKLRPLAILDSDGCCTYENSIYLVVQHWALDLSRKSDRYSPHFYMYCVNISFNIVIQE